MIVPNKSSIRIVACAPVVESDDRTVLRLCDLRGAPTIIVVLSVEDVVECNTYISTLNTKLLEREVVRQVNVCCEVIFQHKRLYSLVAILIMADHILEVCICEVLFSDVLALHRNIEAIISESENVVYNHIRREGSVCVAKVDILSSHVVIAIIVDRLVLVVYQNSALVPVLVYTA